MRRGSLRRWWEVGNGGEGRRSAIKSNMEGVGATNLAQGGGEVELEGKDVGSNIGGEAGQVANDKEINAPFGIASNVVCPWCHGVEGERDKLEVGAGYVS
jgi:hypothetical protein